MNFIKLLSIVTVSLSLILTSKIVFADNGPHFQIFVHNQLDRQVDVKVKPANYSPDYWDGNCSGIIDSTTTQAVCKDAGVSSGLMPDVGIIAYPRSPLKFGTDEGSFDGDIIITSNNKQIAVIHYALISHNYIYGPYLKWDPLKVTSNDPGIAVTITERHYNERNGCYLQEIITNPYDTSCSSSPTIELSISKQAVSQVPGGIIF